MKTKTTVAAMLVALVAVLVPAMASADPRTAVEADVTQLSSDVKAAHDALIPDFASVTADAGKGDTAALKTDVAKLRSDASSLLPAVQKDRQQLLSDLKAATAAGVTGLGPELKVAVAADQAALKELRQAAGQARQAVAALRKSQQH